MIIQQGMSYVRGRHQNKSDSQSKMGAYLPYPDRTLSRTTQPEKKGPPRTMYQEELLFKPNKPPDASTDSFSLTRWVYTWGDEDEGGMHDRITLLIFAFQDLQYLIRNLTRYCYSASLIALLWYFQWYALFILSFQSKNRPATFSIIKSSL